MTDPAEAALILMLTLMPNHNPEHARDLAREMLMRSGCAAPAVEMKRGRDTLVVNGWCKRLDTPKEDRP